MLGVKTLVEDIKDGRRALLLAVQIAIFAISPVIAFLLRLDLRIPPQFFIHLRYGVVVFVLIKAVVFRVANLDRGWWRYVSLADLLRILIGNVVASAIGSAVILIVDPIGFPRSIYLIDLMICFLATAGVRVIVRMTYEAVSEGRKNKESRKNVVIYGAGTAGISLLKEIQNNPKLLYRVRGFLDDDVRKRGVRILGVPVLGNRREIRTIVADNSIEIILIAIPSAGGTAMTEILEHCHAAGVDCKTVPGFGEFIEGRDLAGQIRDVAVEDLLGRKPVHLDSAQICSALRGKVVLVTGAGGSIGSELCRQIARFHPARIVGLEMAETPLFELDYELQRAFPDIPFHAEIGSIQNTARLAELMRYHAPSVIYHAAAYKHVPLMEQHVFEAVENNIFGTYNLAAAAVEHGVESFVMISSDKAVRPTNIMGATKRVAEYLLADLHGGPTKFVAVRFGNVLGSNGSVVPIFKRQIAARGPVTVTHPDMRRFFMTTPEACQLVLQAGVIGDNGQVCVLDMGEPVKIVDLARKLILLSGLRPDHDIKIEYSGIRPGEKLYEELSSMTENTVPSTHEKIRIFVRDHPDPGIVRNGLRQLRDACAARDARSLVLALKDLVEDYNPSANVLRRALEPQASVSAGSIR